MERSKYAASIINPIEAALPAHAHIDEDRRNWSATWTTPNGVWQVAWRDPQVDATVIAVTGPHVQMRWEYPRAGALILHQLRDLGALDSAVPSATEDGA